MIKRMKKVELDDLECNMLLVLVVMQFIHSCDFAVKFSIAFGSYRMIEKAGTSSSAAFAGKIFQEFQSGTVFSQNKNERLYLTSARSRASRSP